MLDQKRLRLEIEGAVQGVGFRPFVQRLATALDLTGWVANGSAGACIEAEGNISAVRQFLDRLPIDLPPQGTIRRLEAHWLAPAGYEGFEIRNGTIPGEPAGA
ncbi:MAG: acylphosphatase [Planctomycetota bacterium]|nr:acylphosphatase [Planctomycetota bacterium]